MTLQLNPIRLRAAVLSACTVLSIMGPRAFADDKRREVLPVGTVVPVKLSTELSSKTSRPGDKFSAVVRYGRDDSDMPEGTKLVGVVREVQPAGDGKPGVIDLDFNKVVFPWGETKPIEGSLVSLDKKNVKYDSRGRLIAKEDKSKDRMKFVGIGAGAGLLIGAITKQNTIASVLLGAGGGFLANELSKKKPDDVSLKPGTEFGVKMDRQFAFLTDRPERAPGDDRYFRDSAERDRPSHSTEADRLDIGVMLDDRNVEFGEAKPLMHNDTVLVPFKPFARAAQIEFDFDSATQSLTVRRGGIRASVGSRIAIVNGERRRMDVAVEIHSGQVYVPMQFLAYSTNGTSYWDKGSKTVVITTRENR